MITCSKYYIIPSFPNVALGNRLSSRFPEWVRHVLKVFNAVLYRDINIRMVPWCPDPPFKRPRQLGSRGPPLE